MNLKLLEQYFPVLRKYPARLSNWRKSHGESHQHRYSRPDLRVTQYVLRAPIPNAAGLKILFLSDLHWSGSPRNFRTLEALEAAATEIAPDCLVLGGDITEDADRIGELPQLLKRLRKLAKTVVAVPGNWETGKRWLPPEFWENLYADAGIVWLRNKAFQAGAVRFHGIDDISSGDCALPEKIDPALPKPGTVPAAEVLVAHSPDALIALDSGMDLLSYDLALCGHNHGGQVRLPLWGALYSPSRYGKRFISGAFRRRNSHLKMLVSTGAGEREGTFRLLCPREVVLVTFRPAHHYRFRGTNA